MKIAGWEIDRENIKRGLRNPSRIYDEIILSYILRSPTTAANSQMTIGTNIFDRNWDVLIILDTCRFDALKFVQEEYEFLDEIRHIWSVGGNTPEWIARTFDRPHADRINQSAYLTANANAKGILEDKTQYENDKYLNYRMLQHFPTVDRDVLEELEYIFSYEPVGEKGEYGHKSGGTPPRYVTDRGIYHNRNSGFENMILHYFQPHSPWVADAIKEKRELNSYEKGFSYITNTGDKELPWNAYLQDLRWVLDDVELLLNNIDAEKVVITSDHGDAFGEWGVLSHKVGCVHPKVRKVPWVVTSARDSDTYTPKFENPNTLFEATDIDSQLEALGYKF